MQTAPDQPDAPTGTAPNPPRQRRFEPAGGWDWLRANEMRMRKAYEETARLDLIAWFAARGGVPIKQTLRALALVALAVLVEMRRALRGEPPTSALDDAERMTVMLADFDSIEEPLHLALREVNEWTAASSVPALTDEERVRMIELATAAHEHAKALQAAIAEDLAAGRLVHFMSLPEEERADSPHLYRLRVQFGAWLVGDLCWGCHFATDFTGEDGRPGDHPYGMYWAEYVAKITHLADAAAAGWGAEFFRGLVPWTDIPSHRAWDAPAPGGRALMDGEPSCSDPTRPGDWVGMAFGVDDAPSLINVVIEWMQDRARAANVEAGDVDPLIERLVSARDSEPGTRGVEDAVMEALYDWGDVIDPLTDDEEEDLDEERCSAQFATATAGLIERFRVALPHVEAAIVEAGTYRRSLAEA